LGFGRGEVATGKDGAELDDVRAADLDAAGFDPLVQAVRTARPQQMQATQSRVRLKAHPLTSPSRNDHGALAAHARRSLQGPGGTSGEQTAHARQRHRVLH
jgi:hypothetical protein